MKGEREAFFGGQPTNPDSIGTNGHECGEGPEGFVPEELRGRRRYLRPVGRRRARAQTRPRLIVAMALLGIVGADAILDWGLGDWVRLWLVVMAVGGLAWPGRVPMESGRNTRFHRD